MGPTGVAIRQTQVLDGLRHVQVQLPNVLLQVQVISVQVRLVEPAQLITVQPGLQTTDQIVLVSFDQRSIIVQNITII
ncbi:hypothetical protein D3C72_1210120 [compost metagenome]